MRSALVSALTAAANGDAETVINLSSLLRDRVRFHPLRRALQIMSCEGESVIASLPLRDEVLVAAAKLLPPAQRIELASISR
jgi:hypothetical protein